MSGETGTGQTYLFGGSMLPFLLLLLPLNLQLLLHVLDISSKTVAVEIVVTGRFGKGLLVLEEAQVYDTASALTHEPSSATSTSQAPETYLEAIETDDTLAMGDVVICENFFPFLRGEKTTWRQG